MKVTVHVKPRASANKVEKISENELKVWVTVLPIDNEANEAVRELLADFYKIAKSRITLIRGSRGFLRNLLRNSCAIAC